MVTFVEAPTRCPDESIIRRGQRMIIRGLANCVFFGIICAGIVFALVWILTECPLVYGFWFYFKFGFISFLTFPLFSIAYLTYKTEPGTPYIDIIKPTDSGKLQWAPPRPPKKSAPKIPETEKSHIPPKTVDNPKPSECSSRKLHAFDDTYKTSLQRKIAAAKAKKRNEANMKKKEAILEYCKRKRQMAENTRIRKKNLGWKHVILPPSTTSSSTSTMGQQDQKDPALSCPPLCPSSTSTKNQQVQKDLELSNLPRPSSTLIKNRQDQIDAGLLNPPCCPSSTLTKEQQEQINAGLSNPPRLPVTAITLSIRCQGPEITTQDTHTVQQEEQPTISPQPRPLSPIPGPSSRVT